jgi:4-amino-4-deoxy-L-arabinose transferase-like glycosyltransferase
MTRSPLQLAAPAIALAVLALTPFLGKAFTVDDTVFLRMAEHATSDPLHPTAFTMVWTEDAARVVPTSGPVMAWLLTPAILAGGAEWVAHLVQLLFLAVAILATVALALRLGLSPAWSGAAGFLLAATPVSLAMAGTAMADVPAMALGVAGLERLLAWSRERRVLQGLLAAVLLGLAALSRTHLLLVLGVGALLLVGEFWRRRSWTAAGWVPWIPLLSAAAIFVGVLVITRDPEAATGLVGTTLKQTYFLRIRSNVAAYLTHWVLALPLAIPWCILRPRELLRRWWALVLGIALSAELLVGTNAPLAFAPIPGLGLAVLLDVAIDGWRRRDPVQLALWAWLLIGLVAAPYAHLPSKYLLASAPAVALLVAREASSRGGRRALVATASCAVAGLALGVAILRADARFAGLGRRAAAELVGRPASAGQRVWITPHWGFQWYAERAGGRPMTLQPPHPAPGDLVVTSDNTDQSVLVLRALSLSYPGRLQQLARIEERAQGGRVMDAGLNAGFFSNNWGFLPWAWGDGLVDGFDLLRIE